MPNALVVYCHLEKDGADAGWRATSEASAVTRGVRIRAHPDDAVAPTFRRNHAALEQVDACRVIVANAGFSRED